MGGARTGRPSARRVVEIVGWSNTTPTSFMRPPHLSHLSTSILKVRLTSCAHGVYRGRTSKNHPYPMQSEFARMPLSLPCIFDLHSICVQFPFQIAFNCDRRESQWDVQACFNDPLRPIEMWVLRSSTWLCELEICAV